MTFTTPLGTLHNQDCLEGLKLIPENSVEACITDIPYGISFMGKEWDTGLPDSAIFKEIFRVMKKGAFFTTTFTPRQDMQLKLFAMLEKVGFNISFSPIYWAYASGFPKAMNYSKAVDKRLGCERKRVEGGVQSKSGETYTQNGGFKENEAISNEAKALDGWYSLSLKPAVEPIIIAQKPHDCRTKIDCALKSLEGKEYAIGGINVDATRIPYKNEADKNGCFTGYDAEDLKGGVMGNDVKGGLGIKIAGINPPSDLGRFPANIVVQDDVLNNGEVSNTGHWAKTKVTGFGEFGGGKSEYFGVGEKDEGGSYSRYFDIDAWFAEKVKKLPKEVQKTFPCLLVPKPASSEKNEGLEGFEEKQESDGRKSGKPMGIEGKGVQPQSNHHPTCKPITLFSYLIKLFARPNELVLDPFMGSGTTAIACETFGYRWLGYELEKEYYDIAVGRLTDWKNQNRL